MNIVKLQDIKLIHRRPLHSYTLTMRKQKEKIMTPFTIVKKIIKYLGINLPKETMNKGPSRQGCGFSSGHV